MRRSKGSSKPPPRSKYNAVRTTTDDGITHHSRKEARRWDVLRQKLAAGQITGLQRQVAFGLRALSGRKITTYVADFAYWERGERVVEDVKGKLTAMYKLKRKWFADEYGITIRET